MAVFAAGLFAAGQEKRAAPGITPLADPPGIHNLFKLGANVFSGSTPEGEEGFEALKKLGVKTIISVDGGKPAVELARKHGMRYVHLPHGYDGISQDLQLRLAKVAEELPGPLYIHCHHGKHRGPAASAVICMSKDGWSPAQAKAWLGAAGTSTNYSGLYDVARNFQRPTAAQLKSAPAGFPETATVAGLVESMVGVDERWENLRAVQKAGYLPPNNHPDLKPANEAVILWEHYREAQRLPDAAAHGAEFLELLKIAETEARDAERWLRRFAADPKPETRAQLDRSFDAIAKSCSTCHTAYRDLTGAKGR